MKKDWYECHVKYRKEHENGKKSKLSEIYIVSAISVTEAEKRIVEELSFETVSDLTVTLVKDVKYKELIINEDGRYYQSKVSLIDFNESTGKEKESHYLYLVKARDLTSALEQLQVNVCKTNVENEICSIALTSILDVI